MSPIDARIPLQGIPFTPPKFDIGDTYVQLARIQALDAQRRGQDLSNRGQERTLARDEAWQAMMAQVMAPAAAPQGPPPGAPGPPQGPPGAPPPSLAQGLAAPVMADQVPFASPEQGQYGLTAPPMPQGMPPSFARAPSTLQAPAMIPGAPGQGLTAPQGPPPPAGMGAQGAPPAPPGGGLTAAPDAPARKPSPFAQMFQPLNMDALQQAYALDPEKTAQWHTRHVQMQGQKIEQAAHRTERMYTALKQMLGSDDPQRAYEIGVKQLRDEGIPLPNDLPPVFDPALAKYQMESLRSPAIELAEQKVKHEAQKFELEKMKTLVEARKAEQPSLDVARLQLDQQKFGFDQQKTQQAQALDRERLTLDQQKAQGDVTKAGHLEANQARSAELQLQAHADTVLKPYREVRDAMGRIDVAGQSPSAAGDLVLLTTFMKLIDPTTGVRDQEFKNAAAAGSILDRMQGYFERVKSGKRLDDDIRNDFLQRSKMLYGQYMKDYEDTASQFKEQAVSQGMNPRNVIQDYRSTTPAGGRGQAVARQAPARAKLDPTAFRAWQQSQGASGPPTAAMIEQYFQSQGGRR